MPAASFVQINLRVSPDIKELLDVALRGRSMTAFIAQAICAKLLSEAQAFHEADVRRELELVEAYKKQREKGNVEIVKERLETKRRNFEVLAARIREAQQRIR